jgi:hypothetical protein
MNRIGSVFILLLAFSPALAQQAETTEAVQFSPEPGYLCDPERQRCHKKDRLNFHMTRIQFGDEAGIELLQQNPQVVDLSGEIFYPEAEVSCDNSVQICYHSLQASRAHTEQYFNPAAAAQLDSFAALQEQNKAEATFVPKRGASCVRSVGICYDHRGPNIGLTRFFFGHEAATGLLRGLLKHQAAKADNKQAEQKSN